MHMPKLLFDCLVALMIKSSWVNDQESKQKNVGFDFVANSIY